VTSVRVFVFGDHWNGGHVGIPSIKQLIMTSSIHKVGFWSGVLAFIATLGYCVVQLLQLYGDISYPKDEQLIYGTSLCIVVPFVLVMLALHYSTPAKKQFWSHAALLFTTLYAVFVTANYVVQLATVIPMTMKGQLDEVRVLQQTPHSLFWDFDALGYIFMGLAAGIAVPVFPKQGLGKWVRWSFIAHALVTPLITVVYFYPTFSYRLLVLGFPWAVTAPLFMLLLALWFRKKDGVKEKTGRTNQLVRDRLTTSSY
jgi:hypothetical protein